MATYSSIKYNFTPPAATISAQVGAGAMTLIKSIDSDGSDATISFVDGTSSVVLDSTYKTYIFKYISIHPETDDVKLTFQGNAAGASGYNETITSTMFRAQLDEGDSDSNLLYNAAGDQAQGTAFQQLSDNGLGNGNDESMSGELWIFNPSNTTFVTHFMARNNMYQKDDYTNDNFIGGYFNATAAIDEIQFKMSSGEIQGGTINMYGIA
tara:strand:- start:19 stop:648 length:630 start_codon:yes stop_codon:yes gene_type:complete